MSMPYGVAVDAERNQVYWTDRKAGRIQRLTLVCQRGVQDLGKGSAKPTPFDSYPVSIS